MSILRSLEQIKNNAWGSAAQGEFIANSGAPIPAYNWDYSKTISVDDVTLWEQLYHESGNFGLFVAWSPYVECYLLVFYPFINFDKGYKIFYGHTACYDVRSFMEKMSVDFVIKEINSPSIAI